MEECEWQTLSPARWRWRTLACCLILGTAALHIAYLACNCPLDLAPDEAHYWDWSRKLDWSYYSKGPLVAYLIRAGCELFGAWSRALTGTDMLAVRMPAILCGSLLLLSLYVLTVQVSRRESLGAVVVLLALTLPLIAVGSSLMTIDAPYTCCWGWALVAGHRAIFRGSTWAWPLTGLLIGLGVLAKYTMILWVPSLVLFLLTSPQQRRLVARPGFWAMLAVAALCCLPVVVWNARNDWVSLRHVSGLAGLSERSAGVRWLGPVAFVGVQFLLLLGYWFVAWLRAMAAHAPWREPRPELRYLWWMSAPTFVVFLLFGFKTGGGEPNWPVTAYVSGLVLTVLWLARHLETAHEGERHAALVFLGLACGLGVALTLIMHRSTWAHPLLAQLAGPPTADAPLPLRRFDPTCRLRGWRTLATAVDSVRAELRAEGVEPVLAGAGWSLPGILGFYCEGQPVVYSFGLALGDRRSQYDFWRPNPVWDHEQFAGKTFVFVGGDSLQGLSGAFAEVATPFIVTHYEGGQPVSRWTVTVCRGYRGFPVMQHDHHF
ncbi:MAG TPA: glycosyltransferase family 39 protein [Gemmataceae bacterium]|nr:glycosyltransferase family 39 protein [Gemmataceae bacterium]